MDQPVEVLLTGFSDEISPSKRIDEQFSVAAALGMRYVTLRFLDCGNGVKNILALDQNERAHARRRLLDFGLQVSSLGSPIGKVKIVDTEDCTQNAFRPWADYLDNEVSRAIELAQFFETKLIRGFSFYHPKGSDPQEYLAQASSRIREIVKRCADAGLVFGLEVEANLIGNNAANLLEIVDRVQHDSLRLIFDGANLVTQGYTTTEVFQQWQQMKPYVGCLHVKDYRSGGTAKQGWVDEERLNQYVPVGDGDSSYEEIFRDLRTQFVDFANQATQLGIPGIFLDLEPHLAGGGQYGGFSGPDGFGIALRSLCKLLDRIKIGYRLRGVADLRERSTN
jgi:sugar phosphate isomerase/epimerase